MSRSELGAADPGRSATVEGVEHVADVEPSATRSVVVPVPSDAPWVWTRHVPELLEAGWDEVVVCSVVPDWETWEALSRLTPLDGVTIVLNTTRRGAVESGVDAADGDVLGYVASDRPVPIEDVRRVYRPVRDDVVDVAVGVTGSDAGDADGVGVASRLRRTLRAGADRLRRLVAGVPVSDLQPDVVAFSREVWEGVGEQVGCREVAFETELLARTHRHGCAIEELPIEGGGDPTSHRGSSGRSPEELAGLATLLGLRWSLRAQPKCPAVHGATRVGLVSCYPPHRGHLAEYADHLADAYGRRDDVRLTVVSCDHDDARRIEGGGGRIVKRLWRRDSLRSALSILAEVRSGDYDVVQFNVQMTYFGEGNLHRFVGLALPPLARLFTDATVVTTMHDFLEVADEEAIGEDVSSIERFGAMVATQLVLLGDVTTVTSQSYVDLLSARYYVPSIEHVPHGTFDAADVPATVLDAPSRVLVFGHLDPFKKDVETVIDAFGAVREAIPDAELWIAGDSHPGFPGYRERLEERFDGRPGVRFVGYVPEGELDAVWDGASIVVLPYRTITGVSGVFQLAKTYATPVVAHDIDGIRESTVDTGGDAVFVPPSDPDALARELTWLLEDPQRLLTMARANADAAGELTIADSADRLLELAGERAGDDDVVEDEAIAEDPVVVERVDDGAVVDGEVSDG